jgi:hypothetical protein
VFFDLEPGVIDAASLSRHSASSFARLDNLVNQNSCAGNNWPGAYFTMCSSIRTCNRGGGSTGHGSGASVAFGDVLLITLLL